MYVSSHNKQQQEDRVDVFRGRLVSGTRQDTDRWAIIHHTGHPSKPTVLIMKEEERAMILLPPTKAGLTVVVQYIPTHSPTDKPCYSSSSVVCLHGEGAAAAAAACKKRALRACIHARHGTDSRPAAAGRPRRANDTFVPAIQAVLYPNIYPDPDFSEPTQTLRTRDPQNSLF